MEGFGIKDIIDILLVAFLMYQTYKLMRETGTVKIFIGIMTFITIWFLVEYVLKMELLGSILNRVVSVGAIGLIVIFQNEIRRFLFRIGSGKDIKFIENIKKFFLKKEISINEFPIMPLIMACQNMSKEKTGALIIIEKNNKLWDFIETGEIINADINSQLLESLFFKNSPLHDGATIISDSRIVASRCILPVSQKLNIPNHFGLRHRAAIGLTEQTDAIAIIVSEESGNITLSFNGKWTSPLSAEQLKTKLMNKLQ
ncbi:MAG: diadenylate cyclase CdaA [Paludibacteraceae bacterium]|nr:diadenylate cyclase CdaA [Paludibacteraceae bacterium]